ncbi:MAG: OmpA family protein [Rhodospirillaceae bacterium]
MSSTRTLMATTAMIASLAFGGTLFGGQAMAIEEGPYVAGGIGLHKPRTNDVTIGGTATEVDIKNGIVGLGAVGWKWAEGFRTEFELGYRDANVDTVGPFDASGSQDTITTMGNLLFDIDTGTDLTVSIGAGVGLAWTGWETVSTSATAPAFFDGNERDFAYQGIVGASFPITERLDFTLDYRYLNSTGLDYSSVPAGLTALDHDNRSHNIVVGLRFALWEPKPEPTPVAQPAPPPPAPAPAPAPMPEPKGPEKFIVFFDFDKSNLTGIAANIVNDAAAYASREGSARITATGHADRAGSTAYNMGLSERRAQAVKAELVSRGIPENEIVILWKGESDNLVPTNDGVREPQNRRVEIIID